MRSALRLVRSSSTINIRPLAGDADKWGSASGERCAVSALADDNVAKDERKPAAMARRGFEEDVTSELPRQAPRNRQTNPETLASVAPGVVNLVEFFKQ